MINGPEGTVLTTQGWMYPESGMIVKHRRVSQALVDQWNTENQQRIAIEAELKMMPVHEEEVLAVVEEPVHEEVENNQDYEKSFKVMELIQECDKLTKRMIIDHAQDLSIELEMAMTKSEMLEEITKHL